MKKRIIALLCIMLIGATLFTGCGMFPRRVIHRIAKKVSEETEVIYDKEDKYSVGEATIDASNIQKLDIDWVSGMCKIMYGDTDKITIKEESTTSIKDDYMLRYLVEDNTLKIKFAKPGRWQFDDFKKTLTIVIPKDMELEKIYAVVVSADLELPDEIKLSNLKVETVSGDIIQHGKAIYGDLSINSVSGDIKLSGTYTEDVSINTVSGDVEFRFVEGEAFKVKYQSVSGDSSTGFPVQAKNGCFYVGDADNKIDVNTVSGDLDLEYCK